MPGLRDSLSLRCAVRTDYRLVQERRCSARLDLSDAESASALDAVSLDAVCSPYALGAGSLASVAASGTRRGRAAREPIAAAVAAAHERHHSAAGTALRTLAGTAA